MASLRDAVKDFQDELRDGIAWVAFWREGRSWESEYFYLEMDDTIRPEDLWRLKEIRDKDPAAVALNGYYCGHLAGDMNLGELAAGVRWHYENGYNLLSDFIGSRSNELTQEEIEQGRAAARAAGLPFSENPYRDGDFDPYVFDGSMSIEDYELMHRMIAEERSRHLSEAYSILIDSRSRIDTGEPGGVWLPMPTTTEQLHAAMKSVGITADNPQDFFINGFVDTEAHPFDVPLTVIQGAGVNELNYLAKLLEMQPDEDRDKFTAAVTLGERAGNIKDLINLAQNLDCYWLYPGVQNEEDYGYYLIDELDELELPEEAKKYFMYEEYGRDAAINDGGRFTGQGYIYNNKNTFTEWYNGRETDIPKEYRVMGFPEPERPDPAKVEMDAAPAMQPAAQEPPQPVPVRPIVLTSEKPAEKLKEITDRLEQGITELFESERYRAYLQVMSKFHNYSFNNTLLIAMQKPDASLVAGFSAWKNTFKRNVLKGEKGIRILAPSPYKVKREVEKIDPQTQKPVIGKDGKPVTEEKEITIPAYKVVSVFDVSQTEGRELPSIGADMLTGSVEQYRDFFAALEKTSPVPIGFEKIGGNAHGYYHLEEKRIAIDEGMSELQTLKTAIHEIAHAKLHGIDLNAPQEEQGDRPDRRTREVQAESVAYTVCQHYGLDTSDYSFGYVAGWSSGRELAELKASLETIRSAAAEIINSIDAQLAELKKDRDQAAAQEQPQDTSREKEAAPEYIYKMEANPRSDSADDRFFVQAYLPLGNGKAGIGDVLFIGTAEKCRELIEQLNTGELTQGQVKELYAQAQETEKTDAALPDPTISVADMEKYGYKWAGMLPLQEIAAAHLFEKEDMQIFRLYGDGSEGIIGSIDEIRGHAEKGGIFGVHKEDWIALCEYRDMKQELAGSEAAKEALREYGVKDTFSIYQLKSGDETRDYHFEPYDRLQAAGLAVEAANYNLIYTAELTPGTSLEDIYTRFNIDHPKDFTGHSLSVSDVVVLHQDGQDAAHYVDSFGFREVPEFLREQAQQLTPDGRTTGEQIRTPRGSFSVTDMTAEEMKAAGYGLHHTSEDGKYLIMGNGTQAYAVAAAQPRQEKPAHTAGELEAKAKAGEQISLAEYAAALKAEKPHGRGKEEKPSIRAQLRAGKEKAAQKKPARSKSQDLERS